MVARITSEHKITTATRDLTAGDLRTFLGDIPDNTHVAVTVDNGDQREPGQVTLKVNIDFASLSRNSGNMVPGR